MKSVQFSIAAVERDTGLAKDTLRVWERRYGFPTPARDANGERLYPPAQVERLRMIKRLMDQGLRPGKLVSASDEELTALATPAAIAPARVDDGTLSAIIQLVKGHDVATLRSALTQTMHRQGLQNFILDTVPQLNMAVGEAWMRGEFEVFEEHLYTEQMQSLLRQAISALPVASRGPRVVLTTVPEEQHVLGLLMSECLLTLEGAACIPLGTQTPLADIVRAASAHAADVVALSFSAAFPSRQVLPLVSQLRAGLPPAVALWLGGGGSERLRCAPDGVRVVPSLAGILEALADWRQQATR
ncbi:MAG: MerR family transcriptional regulator [Rhodocyclaceae bacterium]|nr:MerR family transcriptional regulator [Azospira sp.]HNN08502.1 MerR family transcriptional regulator [Azospira sp.]HNN44901.1 MerR family transcriptional regulator [Azospira sp.]